MSKSLLDIIFDEIFDAEWVGKRGEKLTERELKLVQLLGRKGKVLRNVYLPKEDGETSEVDVIFITQKGIFVFESKNYSGWIFGDEKSQYWTASLPNKEKNRFYNPIKQNRTHMKWMQKFVGDDVPLFSIIVFSERCELKKIQLQSEDIKVIKRDRTYATVREIWDRSPDAVPTEKIVELYDSLKELTNVDKAVKAAHVESIKKRFDHQPGSDTAPVEDAAENKIEPEAETETVTEAMPEVIPEEPVETKETQEDMLCPRCGSKLVLRTAKSGANAGNQFYGCSSFPKCRFIKNL